MRGSNQELDDLFRQMDRMRKAWEHVTPSKKLNKSQFGTLAALFRLSGGREQHHAREAAQCEGAEPLEAGKQRGPTVKTEPAAGGMAAGSEAAPPSAPSAKPVTLSELAGMMRQSLPALSQRVTVLEEKGVVERVANPTDRRVTGLRLTEAGRCEMDAAFRRFGEIFSQAAGRMGRQNMRLLLQLLGELADALNEAAETAEEER